MKDMEFSRLFWRVLMDDAGVKDPSSLDSMVARLEELFMEDEEIEPTHEKAKQDE